MAASVVTLVGSAAVFQQMFKPDSLQNNPITFADLSENIIASIYQLWVVMRDSLIGKINLINNFILKFVRLQKFN